MLMMCLDEDTLTSSPLQVLFLSDCEFIPACSAALIFFNHQLTQNFEGNLKGNSGVQICLVVYQGKVVKWLSGLSLSLVVRTVLKGCSHPSELTNILQPYCVVTCTDEILI